MEKYRSQCYSHKNDENVFSRFRHRSALWALQGTQNFKNEEEASPLEMKRWTDSLETVGYPDVMLPNTLTWEYYN